MAKEVRDAINPKVPEQAKVGPQQAGDGAKAKLQEQFDLVAKQVGDAISLMLQEQTKTVAEHVLDVLEPKLQEQAKSVARLTVKEQAINLKLQEQTKTVAEQVLDALEIKLQEQAKSVAKLTAKEQAINLKMQEQAKLTSKEQANLVAKQAVEAINPMSHERLKSVAKHVDRSMHSSSLHYESLVARVQANYDAESVLAKITDPEFLKPQLRVAEQVKATMAWLQDVRSAYSLGAQALSKKAYRERAKHAIVRVFEGDSDGDMPDDVFDELNELFARLEED